MKTFTGYLDSYSNPNFSGLASISFRSQRRPRDSGAGRRLHLHIESGHGTRQLIRCLGLGPYLVKASGEVKLRVHHDGQLVLSVENLSNSED